MKRLALFALASLSTLPLALSLAQESAPRTLPHTPQQLQSDAPLDSRTRATLGKVEKLRFSLESEEASFNGSSQVLSGGVRLEVTSEQGQPLLTLTAKRAERRQGLLILSGEVRVETPAEVAERARTSGLGEVLGAHGLSLGETLVQARRATLDPQTREVVLEDLEVRARGISRGTQRPQLTLSAKRLLLALQPGGAWTTRASKLRTRLRFR